MRFGLKCLKMGGSWNIFVRAFPICAAADFGTPADRAQSGLGISKRKSNSSKFRSKSAARNARAQSLIVAEAGL